MHLTGKNSRLLAAFWPTASAWRTPRFVGKRHSIHLQETALVVEGEVLRLAFPILDWLFQRALCEWTTITVPYTRIEKFWYNRRWVFRGIMVALLVFLILFGIAAIKGNPGGDTIPIVLITATPGLIVLWALVRSPTYFVLRCRRKDGKGVRFGLAVWPRALRQEFAEVMERHMRQAAHFTRRKIEQVAETVTLAEGGRD